MSGDDEGREGDRRERFIPSNVVASCVVVSIAAQTSSPRSSTIDVALARPIGQPTISEAFREANSCPENVPNVSQEKEHRGEKGSRVPIVGRGKAPVRSRTSASLFGDHVTTSMVGMDEKMGSNLRGLFLHVVSDEQNVCQHILWVSCLFLFMLLVAIQSNLDFSILHPFRPSLFRRFLMDTMCAL